jgi:CRP-like cAMP-binding protein
MNINAAPKNHLLSGLPADEWSQLSKFCESVDLPLGRVLFDVGGPLDYLYFPAAGMISTVTAFRDGAHAESATTGREGVVSVGALLGDRQAAFRNVVQVPGTAVRMSRRVIDNGGLALPHFSRLVQAYLRTFAIQVMQSVACNGTHKVDQRCARWLLMCHDRVAGNEFEITQEFLGEMLGVSRTAVGTTTRRFARAGLFAFRRGRITITDRAALRAAACECYGRVRGEYDRLLPGAFMH